MINDLFSKPAEYTIDSSSLMDIFNGTGWSSKEVTPGLWANVLDLIKQGIIISHVEVLLEIKTDGKKGIELYDWAQKNKSIFQDYNLIAEGKILRTMSPKFSSFVNAKIGSVHADPWLIAQAKHEGLKIITEERYTVSLKPSKWTIPNICKDSSYNVGCLDLLGLSKERGWTFR
ncbi:MAG: DUF4411 family protein [Patescibacteria group bacterium]